MVQDAINSAQSRDEMRQRLAESQDLQRVTAALLQRHSLSEVLGIVRLEARRLTGSLGGGVFLLEDDAWLREPGDDAALDPLVRRIPVAGTFTGQAVINRKPMLVNDYAAGGVETRTPGIRTESLLAVPLQVEGTPIGALNVANKAGGFTEEDARILSRLADVAAVAIESARLRERAEQQAITEERQWLARELHDSVTQAIYSVTLYAEAARLALAASKHDVVADHLRELQAMARDALFDIRLLIFELHPPILEGQGLPKALQIRLSAVENRAGLHTEMRVDGDERLPLAIEEEMYRIALEALNNVVKHARAEHVTVTLRCDDRRVRLEITDDGMGYDLPVARVSGGMGLRGMTERTQRIGGTLEIISAPGKGTTVKVEVPL